MTKNILGVVLAGGKSKRFGSPKAFAQKDHQPFFQYSLDAIEPFVTSTLMITNPEIKPLFTNEGIKIEMVNDDQQYLGYGPLAGIYTAMDVMASDWYMVTPIDVPFVKPWVFALLMEYITKDVDAIVPIVNERKQPLIALYNHSMKVTIKKQLDSNQRSMHQLLKSKQVIYVPIAEEKPFTNINWQKDYQQITQTGD